MNFSILGQLMSTRFIPRPVEGGAWLADPLNPAQCSDNACRPALHFRGILYNSSH